MQLFFMFYKHISIFFFTVNFAESLSLQMALKCVFHMKYQIKTLKTWK